MNATLTNALLAVSTLPPYSARGCGSASLALGAFKSTAPVIRAQLVEQAHQPIRRLSIKAAPARRLRPLQAAQLRPVRLVLDQTRDRGLELRLLLDVDDARSFGKIAVAVVIDVVIDARNAAGRGPSQRGGDGRHVH